MKRVDRALLLAASATVGAGLALLVFPVHAALVGHVWLVVLLALWAPRWAGCIAPCPGGPRSSRAPSR